MQFPWVSRKKYDLLMGVVRKLNDENIRLKIENETTIGNACLLVNHERQLAANERADRELERGHFEHILANVRRGDR